MFAIEKNVPIPMRASSYPFKEMEVGDSFAFEKKSRNRVSAHAAMFCKRNVGWKFSTRTVGENICRIWRIA